MSSQLAPLLVRPLRGSGIPPRPTSSPCAFRRERAGKDGEDTSSRPESEGPQSISLARPTWFLRFARDASLRQSRLHPLERRSLPLNAVGLVECGAPPNRSWAIVLLIVSSPTAMDPLGERWHARRRWRKALDRVIVQRIESDVEIQSPQTTKSVQRRIVGWKKILLFNDELLEGLCDGAICEAIQGIELPSTNGQLRDLCQPSEQGRPVRRVESATEIQFTESGAARKGSQQSVGGDGPCSMLVAVQFERRECQQLRQKVYARGPRRRRDRDRAS